MDIIKKQLFILDNLKALVESGRNVATLFEMGNVKAMSDENFSITEFDDEVVMRFKKRKIKNE